MAFVFVSGRPSLDFVGTLKWRHDEPVEQLETPADLQAWTVDAGLVNSPIKVGDAGLRRAVAVREALHHVVAARMTGRRLAGADIDLLNTAALHHPVTFTLTATGHVRRVADTNSVLSTLTRDALDLIGGPDAPRLRNCANHRCTRIYLAKSHGSRRRWCGMTECGNTAKVTAFRQRHAETSRDTG